MQLNIKEVDDNFTGTEEPYETFESVSSVYEKIPENDIAIKVIKKGVHFDNSTLYKERPINQSIPKPYAKMVRQQIPQEKSKISYEDILSNMGMLVSDGKLHLIDRNAISQQQKEIFNSQQKHEYKTYPEHNRQEPLKSQSINNTTMPNNSYIYNKYFKDEIKSNETVRRPRTLNEYKMMLVDDYLQGQIIKQLKSTKLIMPSSNINISAKNSGNLNKLFNFSKR